MTDIPTQFAKLSLLPQHVLLENPEKEYPIRHRCQFSWYCDVKDLMFKNEKAWRKAQDVAFLVLYNKINLNVTKVLHTIMQRMGALGLELKQEQQE